MPNEAIASRAKSQEWCGRLPNRGSADPETDDVVADELSRKDLLKSVALLGGVGAVAGLACASDTALRHWPSLAEHQHITLRNLSGKDVARHIPTLAIAMQKN